MYISVPGKYQDNPVFTWENRVEIPAEEYICQVCIQCGRRIKMPSFRRITVSGEYQDNPLFTWENGVEIPA